MELQVKWRNWWLHHSSAAAAHTQTYLHHGGDVEPPRVRGSHFHHGGLAGKGFCWHHVEKARGAVHLEVGAGQRDTVIQLPLVPEVRVRGLGVLR